METHCGHSRLGPCKDHALHWLGHVEDHIINQLEVDRSALLMNWKLVEGFVNNVAKVTQARVVNELQKPMLVLTASSISLVKLKGVSVIGHGIVGKDIPIMARLAEARRWSKR
jgi:hypothetical protein